MRGCYFPRMASSMTVGSSTNEGLAEEVQKSPFNCVTVLVYIG